MTRKENTKTSARNRIDWFTPAMAIMLFIIMVEIIWLSCWVLWGEPE